MPHEREMRLCLPRYPDRNMEDAMSAWSVIETGSLRDEAALVQALIAEAGLDAPARARITTFIAPGASPQR